MNNFEDKVLHSQVFLINLDVATDRLKVALKNIADAGFTKVECVSGIHAAELDDEGLAAEWAKHGSPKLCVDNDKGRKFKEQIGRQGCMLSHLKIWKMILEMENVSDDTYFTIFEDDIIFHNQWNTLAPCFYLKTPCDFDILYIGNQMAVDDLKNTRKYVVQLPTYCNHAYIITKQGARKLYHWILSREEGVYTIDETMHNHMKTKGKRDFIWYCWNITRLEASTYALKLSETSKTNLRSLNYLERTTGLVYQNIDFKSFINEGLYTIFDDPNMNARFKDYNENTN